MKSAITAFIWLAAVVTADDTLDSLRQDFQVLTDFRAPGEYALQEIDSTKPTSYQRFLQMRSFEEPGIKDRQLKRLVLPGQMPNNEFVLQAPFSTEFHSILDANRKFVKMACVNWASHMEALIPEGLAHYSVTELAASIYNLGFNCVRYTYSMEMIDKLDWTLVQAFHQKRQPGRGFAAYMKRVFGGRSRKAAMSSTSLDGFVKNNPTLDINTVTVGDVLNIALYELGKFGLFVILDNHAAEAQWCCGLMDGQRWFEQRGLQSSTWLQNLHTVATLAQQWPNVVGIGLRNEPMSLKLKSDNKEWFKHMRAGASTVYKANPNLLIIVSGKTMGGDLRQLQKQSFVQDGMDNKMNEKLVFEAHFYNLIYSWPFFKLGYRVGCNHAQRFLDQRVGFVQSKLRHPLWLSEFGMDVRKYDPNAHNVDTMWLKCVSDWIVKNDVSWAYWVLTSHYYSRENTHDYDETWGILRNRPLQSRTDNPQYALPYNELHMKQLQNLMLEQKPLTTKEDLERELLARFGNCNPDSCKSKVDWSKVGDAFLECCETLVELLNP
ncbi:hypothetical protein MIR68_009751 [Amoeboaphelidium protococcarum]|nr:hypothetical protein MIR68_009751 [Amoeboaphelidium protococcarum]